jgi:type II secretory pathway component GspD/PulD (secretin)
MKRLEGALVACLVLCLLMAIPASAQLGSAPADRIMISVEDADVQDVISMLMKGYGVNVAMSSDVQGRVTLHMPDAPIEQVLNAIAELNDLEWRKSGGVYIISAKSKTSGNGGGWDAGHPTEVASVLPTPVAAPTLPTAPAVAPPVPAAAPPNVITSYIKLKYASPQDIAYLYGFADHPENPGWFFQDRMFTTPTRDPRIRFGPYYEQTYTLNGRNDNYYYKTPFGSTTFGTGPGSITYPQQLPPPPPPTPIRPGQPGGVTQPGAAAGAAAQGPLSPLLPTGIEHIAAIPWLNLLIVRGTEDSITELERIIREVLDVKPKQVTIEAQFLEISLKEAKARGIDFSFLSDEVAVSSVGMVPAGNLSVRYTHGDFAAVLSAVEDNSVGQVINAPKVTTMNNFPANLIVEEDYPYFVSEPVSGGFGSVVLARRLEMAPVTTALQIVPRINEDDSITTFITPQVSDVIKLITDPEFGEVPQISSRSLSTMLRVNDGETIVMGGLVTRKASRSTSRIPLLGQIPILGDLLFTRRDTSLDDTQLLIFLTPRVLHEEEELVPTPGTVPTP